MFNLKYLFQLFARPHQHLCYTDSKRKNNNLLQLFLGRSPKEKIAIGLCFISHVGFMRYRRQLRVTQKQYQIDSQRTIMVVIIMIMVMMMMMMIIKGMSKQEVLQDLESNNTQNGKTIVVLCEYALQQFTSYFIGILLEKKY